MESFCRDAKRKKVDGVTDNENNIENEPVTPDNPIIMRKFESEDIENHDTSFCLRPSFSKTLLVELLVRGQSINLTGDSGQGKSRQLEDTKKLCQNLNLRVALVNLKDFRLKFEFFLKDLSMQLALGKTDFQDFEQLLDAIHLQKDSAFVILIDNMEVLNEYASNDKRYNANFASSINFLKNKDNIYLVCASKEWLKKAVFDDETSILVLHRLGISTLRDVEIEAEIHRQCAQLTATHRSKVRRHVSTHTQAYKLLDFLLTEAKVEYEEKKFDKQLSKWLQDYDKHNS